VVLELVYLLVVEFLCEDDVFRIDLIFFSEREEVADALVAGKPGMEGGFRDAGLEPAVGDLDGLF
jgi:hypothetical protein